MTAPQELPCGERADRHADALPHAQRKRHGAWFTPWALALPTARHALAPLLRGDPATLRIVDPAVGGGMFLRAALAVLTDAGVAPATAAATLHGRDIDGAAAQLAAEALAEACRHDGVATTMHRQVCAGDGLLELPTGSFDAVLTNPPWETLQDGPDAAARVAALRPHFRHQGRGKLYTYRLFVERAFQLLRPGGRLGLVVPASLWFDRDAEPLRRLLLEQCDWQWLYGFENRRRVFAIDSRYRFGVVVATKGGTTHAVRVAFGRTELADFAAATPACVTYRAEDLRSLSPTSGAFVEVADPRDLAVLRTMHAHGEPLTGRDGRCTWRQGDFNMTADRDRFVARDEAAAAGYRAGPDAVWRCPGQPDLLPLYQGAMVGELQPNAAAHAGGHGHGTRWTTPVDAHTLHPAWLVAAAPWQQGAATRAHARLVHRALSNATNERTMVAALLPDLPVGNSLGVLTPRAATATPLQTLAAYAAVLASLPFDWALRVRLGGTNLNAFVLADCVLPRLDAATMRTLARAALGLAATLPLQRSWYTQATAEGWGECVTPVVDIAARRALTTQLDVLVGAAFGLDADAVAWITRGCDQPGERLRRPTDRAQLPAKGFWRVERALPPAARRPLRWLAAVSGRC